MTALKLVMTIAGQGRFTAAQIDDDIDLTIATLGLSDTAFVAAPTLTALPGEFRRIDTVSGEVAGEGIVHLVVQDDAPVTYQIRGFGLFLADGTLFAAYSQPVPIAEKATGSMLALALDIAFPVAGVEQLTFGSTNFLNPPATRDRKGVVKLATQAEFDAGLSREVAVTPADVRRLLPIGSILLWFGSVATVPAGWAICNGQTVWRSDGLGQILLPDMRNRVPVGAGGNFEPGDAFGEYEKSVVSSTDKTAVTIQTTGSGTDGGGGNDSIRTVEIVDPGHQHEVHVDVSQPSVALLFIMRV